MIEFLRTNSSVNYDDVWIAAAFKTYPEAMKLFKRAYFYFLKIAICADVRKTVMTEFNTIENSEEKTLEKHEAIWGKELLKKMAELRGSGLEISMDELKDAKEIVEIGSCPNLEKYYESLAFLKYGELTQRLTKYRAPFFHSGSILHDVKRSFHQIDAMITQVEKSGGVRYFGSSGTK